MHLVKIVLSLVYMNALPSNTIFNLTKRVVTMYSRNQCNSQRLVRALPPKTVLVPSIGSLLIVLIKIEQYFCNNNYIKFLGKILLRYWVYLFYSKHKTMIHLKLTRTGLFKKQQNQNIDLLTKNKILKRIPEKQSNHQCDMVLIVYRYLSNCNYFVPPQIILQYLIYDNTNENHEETFVQFHIFLSLQTITF